MKRVRWLLVAASMGAAALLAGCGSDSTGQLAPLLGTPSPSASTPGPAPSGQRLLACDGALGDAGGGSNLTIGGACHMTVKAKWKCSAQADDMYAQLQAQLANGTNVYLSANVEHYAGPKFYANDVHIFLQLGDDKGVVDSWSDYAGSMTVPPGLQSVQMPEARLAADPGTATPSAPITMGGSIACLPPQS